MATELPSLPEPFESDSIDCLSCIRVHNQKVSTISLEFNLPTQEGKLSREPLVLFHRMGQVKG